MGESTTQTPPIPGVTIGADKAEAEAKAKADALARTQAQKSAPEVKALIKELGGVLEHLKTGMAGSLSSLNDMRTDVTGFLDTLKSQQHDSIEAAVAKHKETNDVKTRNQDLSCWFNIIGGEMNTLFDVLRRK